MNILLVNPPVQDGSTWVREGRCQQWDIWGAPFPPFSLAMISTQLVRNGHKTHIIDAGPEKKDLTAVLAEAVALQPEVIILSTASPTIESDLAWFAPQLKKRLPQSKIVAIGIHVSSLPEKTISRYPAVDFVIIGEPEQPSATLIHALARNENLNDVCNIAFKDAVGCVTRTDGAPFTTDIDTLGFPDWEKIHFPNYKLPILNRSFSLISFSRGCPFSCRYCAAGAYNGKTLRKRRISRILREIEYNINLGVYDFLFWTELMTIDDVYLNNFLDALMAERWHDKIAWICNSRTDTINPSTLKKMKEAGCWQIAFGLEFGSNKILRLAGKGGNASIEQGRQAVCWAAEAGIVVDGHFIMGYPGEDQTTLQQTIDFACSLPLTFAHFYAAVPFPGAPLYDMAVAEGWCAADAWERFTQDSASLTTDLLRPETINQYIGSAYKAFYLRPRIWRRILAIPQSISEFIHLAAIGWSFLRHLK